MPAPNHASDRRGLDVIVRIHDARRLDELGRAVFSLAMQDHRPLAIQLMCQRFDAAALAAVSAAISPILLIVPEVSITIGNYASEEPPDARSALLNQGLAAGQGRYVAFLDYDDVIYPEGHRLLIEELDASGTAIAFGGVLNTDVSRDGIVPMTIGKRRVFQGDGLAQLLHDNFCPLNSFVVDRHAIDVQDCFFDETLSALEDYDFLLRVCTRYLASFRLKDVIIGEYLFKSDGSNTNPLAHDAASRGETWSAAVDEIAVRKRILVLSPVVQGTLGLRTPGLTVVGYLTVQAPR